MKKLTFHHYRHKFVAARTEADKAEIFTVFIVCENPVNKMTETKLKGWVNLNLHQKDLTSIENIPAHIYEEIFKTYQISLVSVVLFDYEGTIEVFAPGLVGYEPEPVEGEIIKKEHGDVFNNGVDWVTYHCSICEHQLKSKHVEQCEICKTKFK